MTTYDTPEMTRYEQMKAELKELNGWSDADFEYMTFADLEAELAD